MDNDKKKENKREKNLLNNIAQPWHILFLSKEGSNSFSFAFPYAFTQVDASKKKRIKITKQNNKKNRGASALFLSYQIPCVQLYISGAGVKRENSGPFYSVANSTE